MKRPTAGSLSTPLTRVELDRRVKRAVARAAEKKIAVKDEHTFVGHLGFDSLRMVSLSLALEKELRVPIALNDWLSVVDDPSRLTVRSLCDYLESALAVHA